MAVGEYENTHEAGQGGDAFQANEGGHTQQLAFEGGDESLPWLESDEDYEDRGVDSGRILAFAAIGLLAIVVLVGGIWWLTHARHHGGELAQGSTIEAPAEPYKTKPANPGGKTFAGTGDTSFAVAEGQTREGKIADEAPKPSIDLGGQNNAKGAKDAAASASPEVPGIGVQVGAYSNREAAEKGWSTLSGQFDALKGVKHRVVAGQADIGTVYRLQAVAADVAQANALCRTLRAGGGSCQVKS